jgi:hypothetical protein
MLANYTVNTNRKEKMGHPQRGTEVEEEEMPRPSLWVLANDPS